MVIDDRITRRQVLASAAGGCLGAWLATLPRLGWADGTRTTPKPDESDAFFREGPIPRLKVELGPAEIAELRKNPRAYVHGRLVEDDRATYAEVGVKLKGAAGSFRAVDDRPALTVNLNKYKKKQTFHALTKIHLNNSVQDGGYLHELVGSELSLAAGVPTARTTHARVWLNDRELGFYVLKEGYDKTFLKRHFTSASGNLYDGGFCQEIDGNLELDSGDGPTDRSDLKALVAACREPDAAKRSERVNEILDVDAFLTFMALEQITCHWDGYCHNRNNYRVYFAPPTNKAYFMPHGMDQIFGNMGMNVMQAPGALVSQVVMQNIEWRARYRERITELIALLPPKELLLSIVDRTETRIQPTLIAINAGLAKQQLDHAGGVKGRLAERAKIATQQLGTPEPKPLAFDAQGTAKLTGWAQRAETEDAIRDEAASPDGKKSFHVACGPSRNCVASWRMKVLLAAGDYKLQARIRTADVVPQTDREFSGAGVRISGGQRAHKVVGTTNWQLVEHPIHTDQPVQELELVAELRATAGQAWFDAESLRLVRAGK